MTLPPLPDLRPADDECIATLVERLGPSCVSIEPGRCMDASRDHAWLSPVLTAALPDVVADVVVTPADTAGLAAVLGIAHDCRVAVTARGRGTGNYGQAVPLAGGIVVDTSALDAVVDVGDGWIHAQAGAPFTRLEAAARATGQELAVFPTTVTSALGGFLAGGAGGIGSIAHGFLWDGTVLGMELVPCWDVPELHAVDAPGALAHVHAYGTTGVLSTATVAVVPARTWTAVIASFPDLAAAVACGTALLGLDPAPRAVSVDDARLAGWLPAHRGAPPGSVGLRAVVEAGTVTAATQAVGEHGGTATVDAAAVPLVVSSSYNHVTLRAKRLDPTICHVQVGGPALVEHLDESRDSLPDGALHLDGCTVGGSPGFGGLLLSRFVDEPTLHVGMNRLRALGIFVVDPHTWALGGHGDLAPTMAAALELDPLGLLNPGKLARP